MQRHQEIPADFKIQFSFAANKCRAHNVNEKEFCWHIKRGNKVQYIQSSQTQMTTLLVIIMSYLL